MGSSNTDMHDIKSNENQAEKTKSIRSNITIPSYLEERIRSYVETTGETKSGLIQRLVADFLNANEGSLIVDSNLIRNAIDEANELLAGKLINPVWNTRHNDFRYHANLFPYYLGIGIQKLNNGVDIVLLQPSAKQNPLKPLDWLNRLFADNDNASPIRNKEITDFILGNIFDNPKYIESFDEASTNLRDKTAMYLLNKQITQEKFLALLHDNLDLDATDMTWKQLFVALLDINRALNISLSKVITNELNCNYELESYNKKIDFMVWVFRDLIRNVQPQLDYFFNLISCETMNIYCANNQCATGERRNQYLSRLVEEKVNYLQCGRESPMIADLLKPVNFDSLPPE